MISLLTVVLIPFSFIHLYFPTALMDDSVSLKYCCPGHGLYHIYPTTSLIRYK